jgi:hypothetical protein
LLLFKENFLELRDTFISSKEYGLDSYLSVRIRHGTLSGELRKPFESENLITQRNVKTNYYDENEYWKRNLNINIELMEQIQLKLNELSLKIDELTSIVKDHWIQIKTEKTSASNGLFDYSYTDKQLLTLYNKYINITVYEDFINEVFSDLIEKTELNLKLIRTTILVDLKGNLFDILNELHGYINALPEKTKLTALSTAIANCKTNVQTMLDKISRWFIFAPDKKISEFNITYAIETGIEILNNVYRKKLNSSIVADFNPNIDGKYFTSFVDVIYILLDNIVKHSQLTYEDIRVAIASKETNSRLVLNISNNLASGFQVDDTIKKMIPIKEDIFKRTITDKFSKEGGSGLLKVKKILQYDMRRKNYEINPTINESQFLVDISLELNGLVI